MTDDDDLLRGIDLDAWAPPPPPPAGPLADEVIARLREPSPASAHELTERAPVRRRRWLAVAAIAAGAAVTAGGVLAIGHWGTTRAPTNGQGEVSAVRARHLDLGPSSAELDPGTDVRWRRDGRRLEVAQPRGRATWRVAGDDMLAIDAGAAVASVEAAGASLRVEVQMNRSDARILGATALTAAAVSLVTIVVYEGHVKVTSAGQTVHIAPGTSYEVRPAEEAALVGASTPDLEQLRQELRDLQARVDAAERTVADRGAPPDDCNIDECILTNDGGACCQKLLAQASDSNQGASPPPTPAVPDSLERGALQTAMAALKPVLLDCGDGTYEGTVRAYVTVAPNGRVSSVRVNSANTSVATCVEAELQAARFPVTVNGGSFSYPIVFAKQHADPCDAEALAEKGKELFVNGNLAKALAAYEEAIACRPEQSLIQKAFIIACNARNAAASASLWARLDAPMRTQAVNVCVRNGITEDELDAKAAPVASSPASPASPTNIPPTLLEGSRIRGNLNIAPDDATRAAMRLAGVNGVIGSFRLCIDATGAVASVAPLKSTGFAAYDARILDGMRAWAYKPYLVKGVATPVCTAITFTFSAK
jgi:TonB family protein